MCHKTTIVYINSADVQNPSDFRITTGNSGVLDIYEYAVQDITVPFTWNTIRVGRNTIQWTATVDGILSVTVPSGNYTATQLATQLTNQMTAVATTSIYTVTYNSITQNFSINAPTDTFRILQTDLDASDLWTPLGFTSPYTIASNTQISVSSININGDNRLFVTSSAISNNDSYQTSANSQLDRSERIASVIIDGQPGSILQDKKSELIWRQWPWTNLNSFDIQLRHEDGSLVDLRGNDWQISIIFHSKLD